MRELWPRTDQAVARLGSFNGDGSGKVVGAREVGLLDLPALVSAMRALREAMTYVIRVVAVGDDAACAVTRRVKSA